ncbi:hypothetical protein GKZ89_19020 [Bacillus mangrovi]|uniref:Exosporium protein C n=1 Tax=Metabacillus mangrovi TaxID=1491830 RepID=A0A7X2S876_9BACI|nr:hypothetical protein [Metabacillus mangrovi]MTH55488.1 hypothetical protein [Metabacillus mangrovi]
MPIQFLDMRISSNSADDANSFLIPAAPGILFGDIGIQTLGVLPENAGDIRVLLSGYARVSNLISEEVVTIRVFRDLATPILVTSFVSNGEGVETFGFDAADFLPAAPASGQVQYTATIETTIPFAILGASNFSGIASAGTS